MVHNPPNTQSVELYFRGEKMAKVICKTRIVSQTSKKKITLFCANWRHHLFINMTGPASRVGWRWYGSQAQQVWLVDQAWGQDSHLDGTSLVNKGFIICAKRELFLARPTREIPSGQDRPISSARVTNQNAGFASLARSRIEPCRNLT